MPDTPATGAEAVQKLQEAHRRLRAELGKVIVGQDAVVDQLLVTLFSQGHALLVGVPGLAKTLLVRSLARSLDLSFSRIQFTPDLMPADVTGTEVLQEDRTKGTREFRFLPGPIFANVVLGDEINRTPPKTQAALLEAMAEHQVTVGGRRHVLDEPFLVLATQNPIEQEGTYPLPEAQLDRFMLLIRIDYPSADEEKRILRLTTEGDPVEVRPVMSRQEILEVQSLVRRVPIADHVLEYAVELARRTRASSPDAPEFIRSSVAWGAGPRASQFLVLGAKAQAILAGRPAVSVDDVRAVAHPVLRHRIVPNFAAAAEGITADHLIDRLLEGLPRHRSAALDDARLPKVLGPAGPEPNR
ncbi:MAG TPA: MoxR family ATPase [Planctomycetota bacterium]|nr:MoxR family ATPase [Planctomycetota bacterium]